MTLLDRVKSPADVRALTRDELDQLAADLRTRLIDVCSRTGGHIGVVLNDNEMSIAPNLGAMSKYLTSIQRNSLYNRVRSAIGEFIDNAPGPLSSMSTIVRKWEESVKTFLTPGVLFEELGFRYFGPMDGHDINGLIETFTAVRALKGPRLVHVVTQNGKGFPA